MIVGNVNGIVGSACLLVCGFVFSAHDVSSKDVISEIAKNYDNIRNYYTNVHGRLINSLTTPDDKKMSEWVFSLSDRRSRVVAVAKPNGLSPNPAIGKEYVYVTSPKISFILSKAANESTYIVTSQENEVADVQSTTKEIIHRELRLLGAPYQLGYIPLLPLVTHPNFRIEKVELVKKDGRPDAWKLIFDADLRQSKHPGLEKWNCQVKGWVCVLLGHRCVIQSYETSFPGKRSVVISGENEYSSDDRGIPLLVRASQIYSAGNMQSETRIELIEIKSGPEPEEMFTMAAYGLMDPPDIEGSGLPTWYVWLGASILVLLGVAIVARRRWWRPM